MVEKACFLSEIIGFLKAGAWRAPGSGRVHAFAAAGGSAPLRRVCGEDHADVGPAGNQRGHRSKAAPRLFDNHGRLRRGRGALRLKSAWLMIIDDCDIGRGALRLQALLPKLEPRHHRHLRDRCHKFVPILLKPPLKRLGKDWAKLHYLISVRVPSLRVFPSCLRRFRCSLRVVHFTMKLAGH